MAGLPWAGLWQFDVRAWWAGLLWAGLQWPGKSGFMVYLAGSDAFIDAAQSSGVHRCPVMSAATVQSGRSCGLNSCSNLQEPHEWVLPSQVHFPLPHELAEVHSKCFVQVPSSLRGVALKCSPLGLYGLSVRHDPRSTMSDSLLGDYTDEQEGCCTLPTGHS